MATVITTNSQYSNNTTKTISDGICSDTTNTTTTTTTNTKTSPSSSSSSDTAGAIAQTETTKTKEETKKVLLQSEKSNESEEIQQQQQQQPKSSMTTNGGQQENGKGTNGDLKILSHIRNIEEINERRRKFLSSTINEKIENDEHLEIETTIIKSETIDKGNGDILTLKSAETYKSNDKNNNNIANGRTHEAFNSEEHTILREQKQQRLDNFIPGNSNTLPLRTSLRSPMTPPPKPPMLSRTRSLGIGDNRNSQQLATTTTATGIVTTPIQSPTRSPQSLPTDIMSVKSADSNDMSQMTTDSSPVKLPEGAIGRVAVQPMQHNQPQNSSVFRRPERPVSVLPSTPKHISANHYERLIEELKCPGCSFPMKAPVLLCQTGHSICKQCTRVLMLCPLCKEPFTTMRSRTVEALCSKAHFRCCNASGGCNVRLHLDLLGWHEKQCIFKPMKCFMGRVWGDCQWSGREAFWKEHLDEEHANKVFKTSEVDLIWNMGVKQKPLTGYYVFDVHNEMFNFYEVYDKERVLFTMTCTSTNKERKYDFAFEVTILHHDNEALALTQKFPVHSEYDSDILAEGTCVSINFNDLAKFIDEEKLLHYRARIVEIKTPRKYKSPQNTTGSSDMHPIDFQQTQIEGSNLKNVPAEIIVTRKLEDIPFADNNVSTPMSSEFEAGAEGLGDDDAEMRRRYYADKTVADASDTDSDPEFEAYISKKWGTPQLHFNRKYLCNTSSEGAASESHTSAGERSDRFDDKTSISSKGTSYTKRVTNSLRKSFKSLKTPIAELKPFGKKSPEKKSPT